MINKKRTETQSFWECCDVLTEQAGKDKTAAKLFNSMYQKAEDYITLRRQWKDMSEKEVCRRNSERTALHDSFIFSFQELAGYIEQEKQVCLEYIGDRETAADFAEYLVRKKESLTERMDMLAAISWAQKYSELVIHVMVESKDIAMMKNTLQNSFGFQEKQAWAIIDMQMRMFSEKEKTSIDSEIHEVQDKLSLYC